MLAIAFRSLKRYDNNLLCFYMSDKKYINKAVLKLLSRLWIWLFKYQTSLLIGSFTIEGEMCILFIDHLRVNSQLNNVYMGKLTAGQCVHG